VNVANLNGVLYKAKFQGSLAFLESRGQTALAQRLEREVADLKNRTKELDRVLTTPEKPDNNTKNSTRTYGNQPAAWLST